MASPKVNLAISLVEGLIQSGELRRGDRLPNEAELSAQLGVSRNSLREAVRAMQAMRILEARQGDGTYVSNLDPSDMIGVLRFAVDMSEAESVYWFLELRRTLEAATVRAAAARRSDADLEKLRAIHLKTLTEKKGEALLALDSAFHDAIAQIAGNPVQAALLKVVSAPTIRARIWRQRLADSDFTGLRTEHGLILDAVASRNVDEAEHWMWHHITNVLLWVGAHPEELSTNKAAL